MVNVDARLPRLKRAERSRRQTWMSSIPQSNGTFCRPSKGTAGTAGTVGTVGTVGGTAGTAFTKFASGPKKRESANEKSGPPGCNGDGSGADFSQTVLFDDLPELVMREGSSVQRGERDPQHVLLINDGVCVGGQKIQIYKNSGEMPGIGVLVDVSDRPHTAALRPNAARRI